MPKSKQTELDDYRTVREVSGALRIPSLGRLINQGRVPFVTKIGCAWMISPKAIAFLREHYCGVRLRGLSGQRQSEAMRREAARLDPQCAAMQRRFARLYPNGLQAGAVQNDNPPRKSRKPRKRS